MDSAKIPSLKQLTLIKVIRVIINENRTYENLLKSISSADLTTETEIKGVPPHMENAVLEKVSQLVIPEVLKEKLTCLVRPCLLQIAALLYFNYIYCNFHETLPTTIHWTPQGTIDKKKTAEVLVQDESVDVSTRFEIACIYCLEDLIYSLWSRLPKGQYNDIRSDIYSRSYLLFWMSLLETKAEVLNVAMMFNGPQTFGLEVAAHSGNEVACRYFLDKLTSDKKAKILVMTSKRTVIRRRFCNIDAIKIYFTDLLCTLLNVMNEEQQKLLFRAYAPSVLRCFFDCPWQNLSTKISPSFWTFLHPFDYHYAFAKLKKRIAKGRKDYDCQTMFRMFWLQIPNDQKERVINYCISENSLLVELFEVLEEGSVRLILKDIVSVMGMKIIFECNGKKIYEGLMSHNRWDSFKFLLEKCALSKDMLIRLKESVENHISLKKTEQKDMLDKSCEIIEQFIQECDKRKNMNEDEHSAKKPCNLKLERNVKT